MKTKLFVICIAISVLALLFTLIRRDNSPDQVITEFFSEYFYATPLTKSEIINLDDFKNDDVINYMSKKFAHTATEKLIQYLYNNGFYLVVSQKSYEYNVNIQLESLTYDLDIEDDKKNYYLFSGVVSITNDKTKDVEKANFNGQLGLLIENDNYKIDSIRFFTNDLLDYGLEH